MPDVPNPDDAAKDAAKESKASVVLDADKAPVRDFVTFDDAAAQAKALGKGAHVVHSGVAFHVADKDE